MWIVQCIVIVIFSLIMVPIERAIYRKIRNKIWAYIITVAVATAILMSFLGIASLAGYNLCKRL